MYGALKVILKSAQVFEIFCPYSKKKYTFEAFNAEAWMQSINRIILDIRAHEENFD